MATAGVTMILTAQASHFFLSRLSFRQQLALTFSVGIILLAVISSVVISSSSQATIARQYLKGGQKVTLSFSEQSKLALLYESIDLAEEVAQVTLGFPDVTGIAIYNKDHTPLLVKGQPPILMNNLNMTLGQDIHFHEDQQRWEFYAPVYSKNDSSEDDAFAFRSETPSHQLVGFVTVVKSKLGLITVSQDILRTNLVTSSLLACALLLLLLLITNRVTKPLKFLARNMSQAEHGDNSVRARLQGPRDIKRMENAFNTMMDTLELRQQELERARDSAMESAQMKGQFVASVSHELRTPLNSILGMMEMLEDQGLPQQKQHYLKVARESGELLLRLINDILDFSKLESSKMRLVIDTFDLRELINDIAELMHLQLSAKHLLFCTCIEPALPNILRGDAGRIRQVIINLLGNAIKFTPAGCISLEVSLLKSIDHRLHLKFKMRDTGIGIDKSAQRLIFQAFSQADNSTSRLYGGTGLGLAISGHLVTLMGGEIGVESQPGQGSCFWFTAELESENQNQSTDTDIPALIAQPAIASIQHHRPILVIEGPGDAMQLSSQLTAASYIVHTVISGSEAVLMFQQASNNASPYSAVVTHELAELTNVLTHFQQLEKECEQELPVVIMLTNNWPCSDPISAPYLYYLPDYLDGSILQSILNNILRDNKDKPLAENTHLPALQFLKEDKSANDIEPQVNAQISVKPTPHYEILVVEDNRANQFVVTAMLEKLGYHARLAGDGKQALETLAKNNIDLILMDCHMPVMDGYQTTQHIRGQETAGQHMTIIAMTAGASDEDKKSCYAIGMDDYLSKPLYIKPLQEKLQHWLKPKSDIENEPKLPEPPTLQVKEEELIDVDTLAQVKEATGSTFTKLTQAYLEDTPATLYQLSLAIENQDHKKIKELSHLIKGSSATLGANSLADGAKQLEMNNLELSLDQLKDRFQQLHKIFEQVKSQLSQEIYSRGSDNMDVIELPLQPDTYPKNRPYVLVVDDDRSMRLSLIGCLEQDRYRIEEASNGVIALEKCERQMPDLILMDGMMEVMGGLEAMRLILLLPCQFKPLIIMLTALDDDSMIEKAFEFGATDFVPKPVNLHVLRKRVAHLIRTTQAEQHVHQLAYQDQLTNLPNRTQFIEKANQSLEQAQRDEQLFALMFLDLDKFKFVNDTQGHDIGDMLLIAVAKRLCHCVRTGDLVVRLGGDEFTILLDNIHSSKVAARVAHNICIAMREPFTFLQQPVHIPVSIGISLFPHDGENIHTLMKHADTAMYRAKASGGDNFQFYEYGMEAELTRRMELERDLRRALEQDELVLHYQPQIDVNSGKVTGVEALVRWNHPDRGFLAPNEFIPLAEESGLILPLGIWVLNQSCRQFKLWKDANYDIKCIAVNISIHQLQNDNLLQHVKSCLEVSRINAQCLQLELTESIIAEEAEKNLEVLNSLKALGVSLAIDDFGTGYSSLSYLTKFPVDTLKIDRSFITNLPQDKDGAAVASGIIALAHKLRMEVVAEGVETEEQRDFLISENCDHIQGYLNCRPLPRDEFETWFKSLVGSYSGLS